MNNYNTKVYFCNCMDPTCNIKAYYDKENDDFTIDLPVFCSILYFNFDNLWLSIINKPFRIIYNLYYCVFKELKAYPDVCLDENDRKEFQSILPETKYNEDGLFDNYYIVNKKQLNLSNYISLILNNDISLRMLIEKIDGEISYTFRT